MGYSFATPCKSKKARDEMLAFLKNHYRSWSQIVAPHRDRLQGKEGGVAPFISYEDRARGPLPDDLSYDHGKCKIGFDYGAGFSDCERYWMYNFCYWMALRVGRRRAFHKRLPGVGAVPYVVYDGYEAWPVLERSEYEDKIPDDEEYWLVDNGFRGMAANTLTMWADFQRLCAEREEAVPIEMPEWRLQMLETSKIFDEIIKGELARLTKLWDER